MTTASVVNLHLDAETAGRVERLAAARERSQEAIVREAVEEYLGFAERRAEFLKATSEAAEHYRKTGLHLTQEEVEEWMSKIERGEDVPMPECHV